MQPLIGRVATRARHHWTSPRGQLLRHWVPAMLGLALLGLTGWIMADVFQEFRFADLWAAIVSIGWLDIGLSIGLTALSFAALVGYEHYAMAFAGKRIGFWATALGAFVAQSIAHTAGFAAVIATSLRYRIYAPRGLDLLDVAKVQAFFVFSFCLGLATLSGIVLVLEPEFPARLVPLPLWLWRVVGISALTAVMAYLAWSSRTHHPLRVLGQDILPPRPWVTCGQILFAFVDLGAGAAALWVLLPDGLDVGFMALLGMFLAAVILGSISHVPGALGVFEGAMLFQIGAPPAATAAVLGALLVYRAIFYLLPFALGCLLYGVHEADRLRNFLREARGRGSSWADRVVPTAAAGVALVVIVVLLL